MFLAGATFVSVSTYGEYHFMAPWPRLAVVGALVLALVVGALRLPPVGGKKPAAGRVMSPWLVFALALVAGGVFMVIDFGFDALPWWLVSLIGVVVLASMTWLAAAGSVRTGWDGRHRLALAAGALLTYAWHAFTMDPLQAASPTVVMVGHVVFAGGAVILALLAARRVGPGATPQPSTVDRVTADVG
jgi:hypothetical protein